VSRSKEIYRAGYKYQAANLLLTSGAKARCLQGRFGTAEAVPCQITTFVFRSYAIRLKVVIASILQSGRDPSHSFGR
jgi:hypothetical protein